MSKYVTLVVNFNYYEAIMNKLFSDNAVTSIKQGNTGDGYLLAMLDCLMNTGPEGLLFIKSLFTETEDNVVVRIKRTELSRNLVQKNHKNFVYLIDENTNEDVFLISKSRCLEIDNSSEAVQTDSLAVKILEKICSYYFYNSVQSDQEIYVKSIDFIAQWLSLGVQKIMDVDRLIKLKKVLPELPVYLSMSLGDSRHAFRFAGFDEEQFTLINPRSNERAEMYPLSEILNNSPECHLLKTNTIQYELASFLLNNDRFLSAWVSNIDKVNKLMVLPKDPDICNLREFYLNIKDALTQLDSLLRSPVLSSLSKSHIDILNKILNEKKIQTGHLFNQSGLSDPCIFVPATKECVSLTMSLLSDPDVMKPNISMTIPSENTMFTRCSSRSLVGYFKDFPVSFRDLRTEVAIEQHKETLIIALKEALYNNRKLAPTKSAFFVKPYPKSTMNAYHERIEYINNQALLAIQDLNNAPGIS